MRKSLIKKYLWDSKTHISHAMKRYNKFCLTLQKSASSSEYMDDCERFIDTLLLGKEEFYSNLTVESISDADDKHGKRV